MRTDRLVLNCDSPFSRYIGQEHIQEVHDGWIYQSWLDHYEDNINKRNWFPVGLLLYVDKMHTDVRGQFCLEPVIAYLTLLETGFPAVNSKLRSFLDTLMIWSFPPQPENQV